MAAEAIINDINYHSTPGYSFRFMLLVLGALSLMAVDYRDPTVLVPVRTLSSIAAYPLLVSVDSPHRFYNRTAGYFTAQTTLAMENSALKSRVQYYEAQQQSLSSLQQENQRLHNLLKSAPHEEYDFVMAETLEAANDRIRGVVTINKGANDGVFEGQVVLSGGNIYGQVIAVTPLSATVMQLVDRGHTIPVRNQRDGERALASGTGRGGVLEIKNLPANTKVREGDIFVSSGLGGIFPADFPVAQVIPQGVEFKQGDSFATVKAQPLTNYEATREVLLVWRKPGAPPPSPAPAEARVKPEPTIKDVNAKKDDKKEHHEPEPRHARRNNTKPAGGH